MQWVCCWLLNERLIYGMIQVPHWAYCFFISFDVICFEFKSLSKYVCSFCIFKSVACAQEPNNKIIKMDVSRPVLQDQKLVESFGFRVHLYADNTQFHDSCRSSDAAELAARAMRAIEDVRDWMSSNRFLRLNADKTLLIWLGHVSDQFHSRKWRKFIPILDCSWNARWTSSAKSVTFIYDVWEQSAGQYNEKVSQWRIWDFIRGHIFAGH